MNCIIAFDVNFPSVSQWLAADDLIRKSIHL